MKAKKAKYPGIPVVINGNGAVAHVMGQVCGGVIGYPITPSTEISEIYEAFRAEGGVNVWGKHPFFFEPEGEHSAQSGALGAQLTGGQYISNASSSQGILYGLESHYVTVGKKVGGFVLQVAARVVSKHALNVMAGHDDVYALLSSGYTILFGANPQEAADLAAIAYRTSALSLIPVTNAMDGFATSHMMSEVLLPEPELLKEYVGDPQSRIKAPTVAQEVLLGAKGRVNQLNHYLDRHAEEFNPAHLAEVKHFLANQAAKIEKDNAGKLVAQTQSWIPEVLHSQWQRQWLNAYEKGTRQRVPAWVDVHNPGLTGPVQNQPDFQAGAADHRTHFASEVPTLVRQAMAEYSALTGRHYAPVHTLQCDDADYVMVALGSVCDDIDAVVSYLRAQGQKVGLVAIKLLQPFPEAEVVAALAGKKAVTVLERSEQTALTPLVTQSLFKARENSAVNAPRHPGIAAIDAMPILTTAIFGLGGHDLQPRHLIAAFNAMQSARHAPLIYLGSQFFTPTANPQLAQLQKRMKAAYPQTELMALENGENPRLLPASAFRIRFHSVGGYGTIASGKLLTDILAGVLGMHSKSAPKYGSEKSGAPTNYYITLSPEPIKITNAELEDVEVVISPDHKSFVHTNPLKGLVAGGTFILQSSATPQQVWAELPVSCRKTIREKNINFLIIDAFSVAKNHAPTPELATRMMGIAFIGALASHVPQVVNRATQQEILERVAKQIGKKFAAKGESVVAGNMAVIKEGIEATQRVDYNTPAFAKFDSRSPEIPVRNVALSASVSQSEHAASCSLFDQQYFNDIIATPFKEGTISEAPVMPGSGLFMPPGSAAAKDKGLFRRTVPLFNADKCTGCMECALVCPDAAIPNTVQDIHQLLACGIDQLPLSDAQRNALRAQIITLTEGIRAAYQQSKAPVAFHQLVANAVSQLPTRQASLRSHLNKLTEILADYPLARTRPFFDAMEKSAAGSGGLFAATVDPWKCTGCLECVQVCGAGALTAQEQQPELLEMLQKRFELMSKTPNTPLRFFENATDADGDTKRLLLDRNNYYSTTGGHGGCRGCGEVTAIRQVIATNHAITERRKQDHLAELEALIPALTAKKATLAAEETQRIERIEQTINTLEKRLYLYEGGPTGDGPSGAIIANSTGCSSVYASTLPFNAYKDPWVNSLFQDAQPLAKGIFEGIAAQAMADMRALRTAKLELADAYLPAAHDRELRLLSAGQLTAEELALLPNIITIGGDGATYDIGFGALSRILASNTPIKVVALNTGAYSNTGGQASTSSFIGQDADLARVGAAHHGKFEARKELGLIAAFHANVFVCATTTAMPGHFLKNVMECLKLTDFPALLDIYTPCQGEHGVADNVSAKQARLAVESRMSPLFVHDPRRGTTLHDRFSLEGNPDPLQTWSNSTLEYLDDNNQLQLMTLPLTPAHFALTENRFRKQFHKITHEAGELIAVELFIDLPAAQRVGKTAFIYATDNKKRLNKLSVSPTIIALVEERRKNWILLQYLAGQHVAKISRELQATIAALRAELQDALKQRDASLDAIAQGMVELACTSQAPLSAGSIAIKNLSDTPVSPAARQTSKVAESGEALTLTTDPSQCTNCKTCYQELPELFEKTTMIINGESREVARIIPGALEHIAITPELQARIKRVSANCDAEIIK
jgi:pyruvate-ferredoxin/flavodoxin oxidoreductase